MLVAVFVICFGLFMPTLMGVYFLFSVIGEIKSKSWPVVEGKIVSSRVMGDPNFIPQIIYEYSINGASYKSNRIDYVGSFPGKKLVSEKLVTKYYEGKLVSVYYNPKSPRLAVLELGFKGLNNYIGVLIAFALYAGTFGSFAIVSLIEKEPDMPIIGWIAIVASFVLGIATGRSMNEFEHQDTDNIKKV